MTAYAQTVTEHRRLTILRLLNDAPAYTANSSILSHSLNQFGLPSSRDQVLNELAWLAEQGLITLEKPVEALQVAKITERGIDVAKGLAVVPGVKRPGA